MLIPELDQVIKNRHLKRDCDYFRKNYNDFYIFLQSNYSNELPFIEKLYWYYHNIKEFPKCKTCGNPVKFINFIKGYHIYCSPGCASKNKDIKQKKIQTCIEHYGVENPSQSNDILKKKEDTFLKHYGVTHNSKTKEYKESYKQTCIEHYGVENPMQCEEVKDKVKRTNLERYGSLYFMGSNDFIKKSKQTNLERYGVGNPMQYEEIKNKVKQTNLERYGVENPSMCERINEKVKDTWKHILQEKNNNIIDIKHDFEKYYLTYVCKCPDPKCNKCKKKIFEIKNTHFYYRLYNNLDLCNIRTPNLGFNSSLEKFIENILKEYNINYILHEHNILNKKELDIYIPDKKIAIECNGVYWHSDKKKDKKYHYNKFKECQEHGIQLINIWEDQVIKNPDKIISIIKSKLGIYKERIYARCCKILPVTINECKLFIDKYHLQNYINSSIRLGLYYNNELVSVMTFGKSRKILDKKSNGFELYRYCCKADIQIIGGASKLFKYFIKKYNPDSIVSFSSNDISNGNLYKQLGFIKTNNDSISYWYIDRKYNRYHRYNFRKDILVKNGYDKNKTEFEIMDELGFYRIYDSGQSKWIINL